MTFEFSATKYATGRKVMMYATVMIKERWERMPG